MAVKLYKCVDINMNYEEMNNLVFSGELKLIFDNEILRQISKKGKYYKRILSPGIVWPFWNSLRNVSILLTIYLMLSDSLIWFWAEVAFILIINEIKKTQLEYLPDLVLYESDLYEKLKVLSAFIYELDEDTAREFLTKVGNKEKVNTSNNTHYDHLEDEENDVNANHFKSSEITSPKNREDWLKIQRQYRDERYKSQNINTNWVFSTQSNLFGLSGKLIDSFPKDKKLQWDRIYGGTKGLNEKRLNKWKHNLKLSSEFNPGNDAFFLSFTVDGSEWVPHPEIPPIYQLIKMENFFSYNTKSLDYFNYANELVKKNNKYLQNYFKKQFTGLDIKFNANYWIMYRERIDLFIYNTNSDDKVISLKAKWKNESLLYSTILKIYPDTIREYSPNWLGSQRLDIFVPCENVAIEYQGQQHYEPVEFFGGEENFKRNKERDERKKNLCKYNGIKLLEWPYTLEISEENVRIFFKSR